MNVKEKAHLAVMTVKKKALPVIASASVAMSTVAVNAFAVDADSFKSGATSLSVGFGLLVGAIIPILIGIVGVYSAIGAGKKILTKLAG